MSRHGFYWSKCNNRYDSILDLIGVSQKENTDFVLIPLFIRRELETSHLFVGTKMLATIFAMKTQTENIAKKIRKVKIQTDHGQTELSNMLVRKNVLNEINKEGTFTQGFKDFSKFRRPSKLADKVTQIIVKAKPAQTLRESVATL